MSLKTVSLLIVTVEEVLPNVAPDASLNVTVNDSGPSAMVSLTSGIVMVPEVCPAAIVSVPDVVV